MHSSTLLTVVAMETWRAGAASVDGVTGTAINTGAGLIAAVTIETSEALCKQKTKQNNRDISCKERVLFLCHRTAIKQCVNIHTHLNKI